MGDNRRHRPPPGRSTILVLRHLLAECDLTENSRSGWSCFTATELPATSQRVAGERRIRLAPSRSTIVAGRSAQADRLGDDSTCGPVSGSEDHEGDVESLAVQAFAMTVEPVLAQFLAMIRRDDDQGVVERAASLEFTDQLADL